MCQMRKTYPRGSVKENFVCRDNKKQELDMKRSFFGRPLLSMSAAFVALAIAWPAGAQSQQPIYGSQLMTQQERLEYQQRIRSAKSQAERQRIRSEHHAQMQERARQKGVTLPGMGPGQGQGMGPGQGQGMGPGQGRGSRPRNGSRPRPRNGSRPRPGMGPGQGQGMGPGKGAGGK